MSEFLPSITPFAKPLDQLSTDARQAFAHNLFGGLCREDGRALGTYRTIVEAAIDDTRTDELTAKELFIAGNTEFNGYFDAKLSHGLLTYPRVSGFVNAIRKTKAAKTAIDIGTGSSAVLAVATALFHPGCTVEALEVSPLASESARRVIELFGLTDRIEVRNVDAFEVAPRVVDLVVSETFHMALGYEKGAILLNRYAKEARTLLPARAVIAAAITHAGYLAQNFTYIDTIDFRKIKDRIEGVMLLEEDSEGYQVLARSSLLTESGGVIVSPRLDPITSDDYIGTFSPPSNYSGEQRYVSFSYAHSTGAPSETFQTKIVTAKELTK
jgi:predicted O-methyltransferase YrrM